VRPLEGEREPIVSASAAGSQVLLFNELATTQTERAYRALLEDIVTLRLGPGEVLSDEALRGRLSLGRTPIREALQRLALERLVVIIPRKGVMVSEINITDLSEIYEVRAPLEGVAARLAAERLGARDLPRGVGPDLEAIPRTGDFLELVAIDHRLHRAIHSMARNSFLLNTLDWYLTLSYRLVFAASRRLSDPPSAELAETMNDFHDQFAAIGRGDAAAAEDLARRHAAFSEHLVRRVV
jgi:DNA-binding GntR family transcriptional regulator